MEPKRKIFVNSIDWKQLGYKAKPMRDLVESELCNQEVTIYNHKYMMQNGFSNEAVINGFFSRIKQPTRKQVCDAMLLIIDEDYALKAGGESSSDNQYSSSFKILIADPKTGLDKEVVVIKKWSKTFENVLITAKEISRLFRANLSSAEKQVIRQDDMKTMIAMTLRAFSGFKITCVSGNTKVKRKLTTQEFENCLNACREYPRKEAEAFVDHLIQNRMNELNAKYVELYEGQAAEITTRNQERLAQIQDFKRLLFQDHAQFQCA